MKKSTLGAIFVGTLMVGYLYLTVLRGDPSVSVPFEADDRIFSNFVNLAAAAVFAAFTTTIAHAAAEIPSSS